MTGAMLEPYRVYSRTIKHRYWMADQDRGSDLYFAPEKLADLLIVLGRIGIDPYLHADGDAAVHAALNRITSMRKALPHADIRPAIAHDEIGAMADLQRFRQLNVTAVLSFKWVRWRSQVP